MFRYKRLVQYYETDKMQVVHHANYFHWFEEARQYALVKLGVPYPEIEKMGYVSPVLTINCEYHQSARYGDTVEVRGLTINCEYHQSARYGDTVEVRCALVESKSIRSRWIYTVVNEETGELLAVGSSTHCFLKDGKVVALSRVEPELHAKLMSGLTDETEQDLKTAGREE